uniref:peptide deformylase n=1 Tax=Vibrio anguillarum TaxID=55601 RepID=UPI00188D516A
MAVLEILKAPDPRLKIKAEKVQDITTVQTLIDDMLETLYATDNGIGLASTQVGRKEAVVIIDLSES